jgi:hypothetical protein
MEVDFSMGRPKKASSIGSVIPKKGRFLPASGGPIICYSEVRNSTQFETIEVPVDKK